MWGRLESLPHILLNRDEQDAGPTDTLQNLDIRRFIQQGLFVARPTPQRYATIFSSGAKHALSNYASVHLAMSDTLDNPRIHLILASGSPRRMELLGQLGIKYMLLDHGLDETALPDESPQAHVRRLAKTKAVRASKKAPDIWVLGADTIVVIDEKILGKPRDEQEARDMLASLAGRTHEVFTGYALVRAALPGSARVRQVRSRVHIRNLSPDEIDAYVRTGEPMDKAGAYAIQGIGAAIVEWIQGSYTNVVGLPICELAQDLKELGIFDFLLEHRQT